MVSAHLGGEATNAFERRQVKLHAHNVLQSFLFLRRQGRRIGTAGPEKTRRGLSVKGDAIHGTVSCYVFYFGDSRAITSVRALVPMYLLGSSTL